MNGDLRVKHANEPFYESFQVSPAETEGRPIYELDNRQWDIPKLRTLLEEILPLMGSHPNEDEARVGRASLYS